MRRLGLILIAMAAATVLGSALLGPSAQGSSTSRFDVIFDDARGLIGGQLIKVAGAQAGTIDNVTVTSNFKARIEATIDSRFMPFHQDATCTIRPEGLIAENYIDCDPGSANSPPLHSQDGQPPTVPVSHTTEPVSLLDLFNMFNLPTRERFQAIIDELGVGTSGRGRDFNNILRRANPALSLARQAISILARQQSQLAGIVQATDVIAREGAGHTAALQRFLERTAALTSLTAAHRDSLSATIARLPALLAAARPALARLDAVAVQGTPLLSQIHAAVPGLNRVSSDLGPFARVATPALAKLSVALRGAIPALRDAAPLTNTLRAYAARSLPGTLLFARLASNLQRHGFVENFLGITYYIAASLARFDATSHMLSILLVGARNGTCGNYSTTPVPGCSAHYGTNPAYKPQKAASAAGVGGGTSGTAARTRGGPSPPGLPSSRTGARASGPSGSGSQGGGGSPSDGGAGSAQSATPAPGPAQNLNSLIHYLLG